MTKCIGLNIPSVISKCYSFPTTMSTWHRGIDEIGNCPLFGVLLFLQLSSWVWPYLVAFQIQVIRLYLYASKEFFGFHT